MIPAHSLLCTRAVVSQEEDLFGERTGTGTFEATANPCNHGNFYKGSLETAGRPLSKHGGGGPMAVGPPATALDALLRDRLHPNITNLAAAQRSRGTELTCGPGAVGRGCRCGSLR